MQREREHTRGLQLTTGRTRRRLRARTNLTSSPGLDESSPRGAGLGLGLGLPDDDDDDDEDNDEAFESHMDAATARIIEQTRRVASRLRLASLPRRPPASKESDPGAGPVPETDQERQGRETRGKDGGNDVTTGGYNTL